MRLVFSHLLTMSLSSMLESSHFYGGTVTWEPYDNMDVNATILVRFVQMYQWRQSQTHCDSSYVANQNPLIPRDYGELYCVSNPYCDNYMSLDVRGYCTDFSNVIDSSSSYNSNLMNLTLGAKFCVAFEGAVWPGVLMNCEGLCYIDTAEWSIGCCVDLTPRPDGWINTPPVPSVISPLRVPRNQLNTIAIPVRDADNDVTICRWAMYTPELDECGGICGQTIGSTLDNRNCTLTFDSTGTSIGDLYPVALMVEDFANDTTTTPYSRVPIQFLIEIIGESNCSSKPIIRSNLPNETFIEVGSTFQFTLNIQSDCPGVSIIDYFRNSPLNMGKSALIFDKITNRSLVTETWTPTIDQVGTHTYCAVATNSDSIQSDVYCRTFVVHFSEGSRLETSTTTSTTTDSTRTSTTTSTSTTAQESITILVTVTIPTTDNSKLIGLGFGLGLPLLLSLLGFSIFAAYHNHRRLFSKYRVRDNAVQTTENSNNIKPDYREEYIKPGSDYEANQSIYLDAVSPLRHERLFEYLAISELQPEGLRENIKHGTIESFLSKSKNHSVIDIKPSKNSKADYREQYIKPGNDEEASQSIYLDTERPLTQEMSIEYLLTSNSDVSIDNMGAGRMTKFGLFSSMDNNLVKIDTNGLVKFSSHERNIKENDSILKTAYAKQQQQANQ